MWAAPAVRLLLEPTSPISYHFFSATVRACSFEQTEHRYRNNKSKEAACRTVLITIRKEATEAVLRTASTSATAMVGSLIAESMVCEHAIPTRDHNRKLRELIPSRGDDCLGPVGMRRGRYKDLRLRTWSSIRTLYHSLGYIYTLKLSCYTTFERPIFVF